MSKEGRATKRDEKWELKRQEEVHSGMGRKERKESTLTAHTFLVPCCTVHTSERTSQPEDDSSLPQNTALCSDSPLL